METVLQVTELVAERVEKKFTWQFENPCEN